MTVGVVSGLLTNAKSYIAVYGIRRLKSRCVAEYYKRARGNWYSILAVSRPLITKHYQLTNSLMGVSYIERRRADQDRAQHCNRCWRNFSWGGQPPECSEYSCDCHKGNPNYS